VTLMLMLAPVSAQNEFSAPDLVNWRQVGDVFAGEGTIAGFPDTKDDGMEQTSLKQFLDDLERRVAALRGYL